MLFIKSLPIGSQYAILNFGTNCKFEMYDPGFFRFNRKLWDYNDKTTEKIIEKLMDYDADYGGTDILKPL